MKTMEIPQTEKWISFKGCEMGFEYFPQSDEYVFFTARTVGNERREKKYYGENAAQEARIAYLGMIESLFDGYFKKKLAETGFNPITGKRTR